VPAPGAGHQYQTMCRGKPGGVTALWPRTGVRLPMRLVAV